MIKHAYVGFGSNLGDRRMNCLQALQLLRERCSVLRVASVVESRPVDHVAGGNFLNTVIECERTSGALEFLKTLQEVEREAGGATDKQGGARTCDLDVLLWGEEHIESPELNVPHPRLHARDFYLIPLCELIGRELHPRLRKSFADLLAEIQIHSVIGQASV